MTDDGLGPARTGLVVLAVSVFAAVTTELLPVGLLPQISDAFDIDAGTAGLLVTAYAVMVALLAVPLTLVTGRLPRKPVLLATIAGYVLSNVVAALAPTFAVLAVGRAIGGMAHALFFSVCIGYAARLVPPARTGRAMALASAGGAAGGILGVPLSTALGTVAGWRFAFVALAVLVALALLMAWRVLPAVDLPPPDAASHPGRVRDLAVVVAANGLTFLGMFTLYTYVSVLLIDSGAAERWVGPTLLVFGVCGLVGLRSGAAQLDHRPRGSAILVPALMAAAIAAVALSYPRLAPLVVAAMVWLAAFGPAASLYQSASVRTSAGAPETAGAWINASSNVGIGGGAALGAVVMAHGGLGGVAWVAAAVVASASLLAYGARSAFPPGGHGHP